MNPDSEAARVEPTTKDLAKTGTVSHDDTQLTVYMFESLLSALKEKVPITNNYKIIWKPNQHIRGGKFDVSS